MLRWFAQFFDGIAVKMMLGSLNKRITFEYEKSGHARKQAEEMAWQEMFIQCGRFRRREISNRSEGETNCRRFERHEQSDRRATETVVAMLSI